MDVVVGALGFEVVEDSNDDALRCCLEQIAMARRGHGVTIIGIDRRPAGDGSSYAADAVTVSLAGGDQFQVFVKYFGSSRYHKQEPGRQAEREIGLYRAVLTRANLGTAEYYGALCDASRSRCWLFVEYVTGTPVAYREFECWTAAAGWLGRLHGYFARRADRLHGLDFLIRHDASFFQSTAQRALTAVAAVSPVRAERLSKLLRGYSSCIDAMATEQPVLVHGAFKPRHVLVDDRSEPRRVCPIDWELAATGSNLYDLAFLAHGLDPPAVDRLLDAYADQALAHDLRPRGRNQMRYILDCVRLHRILKALGRSEERAFSEDRIAKAIAAAEQIAQLVCG